MQIIKHKTSTNQPLTKDERIRDLQRQLKPGTKYLFPSTAGITGEVFKSHTVQATNQMKQLKNFVNSVDNISRTEGLTSCLIAPLFGHVDSDTD